MFAGSSKTSTSIIVEHVQHIEIIRTSCLPGDLLSLSVLGGGGRKNCWVVVY